MALPFPSPDYRSARFARRFFSRTPFFPSFSPQCGAWSQATSSVYQSFVSYCFVYSFPCLTRAQCEVKYEELTLPEFVAEYAQILLYKDISPLELTVRSEKSISYLKCISPNNTNGQPFLIFMVQYCSKLSVDLLHGETLIFIWKVEPFTGTHCRRNGLLPLLQCQFYFVAIISQNNTLALQSSQVKRSPLNFFVNEFIIRKLSPLAVVDFRSISTVLPAP